MAQRARKLRSIRSRSVRRARVSLIIAPAEMFGELVESGAIRFILSRRFKIAAPAKLENQFAVTAPCTHYCGLWLQRVSFPSIIRPKKAYRKKKRYSIASFQRDVFTRESTAYDRRDKKKNVQSKKK